MSLKLGIDASNIRQGGGITHLSRLLSSVIPSRCGIESVTVWSCARTLGALPNQAWLDKRSSRALEGGLPIRMLWQNCILPSELIKAGCNILFSPGGTLPGKRSIPAVTMSQNMLPFEPAEAALFGTIHPMRLKMFLLRLSQSRSFKSADGLIFLSDYARSLLCTNLGLDAQRMALIPHGIEERFFCAPRPAMETSEYSAARPFRLLYVSILMPYKHQLEIGRAVARLRDSGVAVSINFVGDQWGSYGKAVEREFRRLDPRQSFLKLLGPVPFERLHMHYVEADAFVFASSCENLPNILIEAMASGLPILSSSCGPMPEVLGDAGWYFDPYSATSIADTIVKAMQDPVSRHLRAMQSFEKAKQYSWPRCASDTFSFIAKVAQGCGV